MRSGWNGVRKLVNASERLGKTARAGREHPDLGPTDRPVLLAVLPPLSSQPIARSRWERTSGHGLLDLASERIQWRTASEML